MTARALPRTYAGIVTRGVAFLIDVLIVDVSLLVVSGSVAIVLAAIVPGDFEPGVAGLLAGLGVWSVAGAVYFVAFWTLTGQTVGMRVMRLRVTDASGARPRVGRAVVRVLGMWLAAVPLMAGYVPILFDDRRQGLHDMLAGTFVVHAPTAAHPRAPLSRPAPHDQTAGDLLIDPEERPA